MKDKIIIAYHLKPIVLLVFLLVFLANCERDDICADTTPTTPNVNISFFDNTQQDVTKTVSGLEVRAEGLSTLVDIGNSSTTAISLPLLFSEDGVTTTTRFILKRDSQFEDDENDETESNEDTIELTYTPQFLYVSRACGYKSIFNDLSISIIEDEDNWILNSNILTATVQDVNEVHINLFH